MQSVAELERIGANAVKRLRKTRLSAGIYFMINSNALPPDHCYLEYPDGLIKLATYESHAKEFKILRVLEEEECRDLRRLFED
jgi:hypothetical protein